MLIRYCYFVLLLIMPFSVLADWALDKQQSLLTYLSSKIVGGSHAAVFENNTFQEIEGSLSDQGQANLVINMDSVNTAVSIRDERIKEHVFQVSQYPQANIALNLPSSVWPIKKMAYNQPQIHTVPANLTMVGKTDQLTAKVMVTRVSQDQILVQTMQPVLLDAKTYGMAKGFETLKNIVGLFNIPTIIPVNFTLVFNRQ